MSPVAQRKRLRLGVVLGLAAAGALAIWIITPYNNFILANSYISDDFLPVTVVALLMVVVLGLNPILFWLRPSWAMSSKELALLTGLLLMACPVSSSGLLRNLPYGVAGYADNVHTWPEAARRHEAADIPDALFPAEMRYQGENQALDWFLQKLPAGEGIPWGAWGLPGLSWGLFFLAWWCIMIGVAGVAYYQWRYNERLNFPLVRVYRALIGPPQEKGALPPVLRKRSFWLAFGGVLFIHILNGIETNLPDIIPVIPVHYNWQFAFQDPPLAYLPSYFKVVHIYFVFVGVAYFMHSRISLSIWVFLVLHGLYAMFYQMYSPPFHWNLPNEHRNGAMIAMTLSLLWFGRIHFGRALMLLLGAAPGPEGETALQGPGGKPVSWVFLPHLVFAGCLGVSWTLGYPALTFLLLPLWWVFAFAALVRRPLANETDRTHRFFAFLAFTGGAGCLAWLVWAGVQPHWALVILAIGFIYAFLTTRIVAETGLSFTGFYEQHFRELFSLIPVRLVSAATAWFLGVMGILLGETARATAMGMAAQVFALEEEDRPRTRRKWAWGFLAMLAATFIVCGAIHLYLNYTHSQSLGFNPEKPVNEWALSRFSRAEDLVDQQQAGVWNTPVYNRPAHIAGGAILYFVLQWASVASLRWPLHPIGLVLSFSWYSVQVFQSVLLGWLLRQLLVFLGGSKLYQQAIPFFLGLIVGEASAAILWLVVPTIQAALGYEYRVVEVLPY